MRSLDYTGGGTEHLLKHGEELCLEIGDANNLSFFRNRALRVLCRHRRLDVAPTIFRACISGHPGFGVLLVDKGTSENHDSSIRESFSVRSHG